LDDAALCRAFAKVEAARGEVPLTYFEFGTLGAMRAFVDAAPELAILEVGLGGRLDAVNCWDAEVALVTTVDLDHQAWLGHERESIAAEKAGIFRPGRPAVYGDRRVPLSLERHAERIGTPLHRLGAEFDWEMAAPGWRFRVSNGGHESGVLPLPALRGSYQLDNAAAVLMVLRCLANRLPVTPEAVAEGLKGVGLWGRFQVVEGTPPIIFDVAHNPQAARVLAENLGRWTAPGRTLAVWGMLADKAHREVAAILSPLVDDWFLARPAAPRAVGTSALQGALGGLASPSRIHTCERVAEALAAALAAAGPGDRVLVFGSFFTVAESLAEAVRCGRFSEQH